MVFFHSTDVLCYKSIVVVYYTPIVLCFIAVPMLSRDIYSAVLHAYSTICSGYDAISLLCQLGSEVSCHIVDIDASIYSIL